MSHALPLIYLCRHGQTNWNAEGRIQGQVDTPLNALGRVQAKRNGRYLRLALGSAVKDFHFVASPLTRTRETMRIIRRECGLEPDDFATDERLMELNFGDWQNRTLEEISRDEPQEIARRDADKWNFKPNGPTAESYRMLADRARPVFEGLAGRSIVVAHGGITRVFLEMYGGVPPQEAAYALIQQDRVLKAEDGQIDWV
ncbi:probable phosphoglycerate mutase [Aureimonas altamirensis DSM 21988]|uniref:Probable phosphoglycerate mutase n=1 Tax=Aureimonas altamirensis DSM 21988 TaxID=1121026 RepID=A0ABY1INJ6_9HYPH|nr:histidine phosphatase family protein [Aureimonas altamirensis]SHJ58912.1 probable phosphoglycerate mutase [Aureimonas altamirensis DSM 21988]